MTTEKYEALPGDLLLVPSGHVMHIEYIIDVFPTDTGMAYEAMSTRYGDFGVRDTLQSTVYDCKSNSCSLKDVALLGRNVSLEEAEAYYPTDLELALIDLRRAADEMSILVNASLTPERLLVLSQIEKGPYTEA